MKKSGIKRRRRRKKPGDCPEHLRDVWGEECLVAGPRCSSGDSDSHHLKTGYGTSRAPDKKTVPLCRHHHMELHDDLGSERLFELKYQAELDGYTLDYWADFYWEKLSAKRRAS